MEIHTADALYWLTHTDPIGAACVMTVRSERYPVASTDTDGGPVMMAIVSPFTDHPVLSILAAGLLLFAIGLLYQAWLNRQAENADAARAREAAARKVEHPMPSVTPTDTIRMPAIGDITGVPARSYFVTDSLMANLADAGDTIRLADGTDPAATQAFAPPPQHRTPPGPLADALRAAVARYERAEADLAEALAEIERLRPQVDNRPRPMIRPSSMNWDALSAALDPVTDAYAVDSDPTMGMAAVPEHHP